MFGLKLGRFCAAAILVILGTENSVWAQPQIPSPAAASVGGTPPSFRPLTDADVQSVLDGVKGAAAAVDQRFASAGDSANGWKAYLGWDQFKAELQKAAPDKAVLGGVYDKLAAGHEGLELKTFADLRAALAAYLPVAAARGSPDLEAAYKSQIDALTQQIKSLSVHPTTEETRKIDDRLAWLETARQAPELVHTIRQRFSTPNFHAQISGDLLGVAVGGPIDDVAPIDDVILGTTVHGTGHTVGQSQATLTPDPNFANFDAVVNAMNYSNNVGRNGPVCIYTTGQTWLGADKRFWLDQSGLHALPAQAAAQAHTTINNIVSIKGRKIVEKIAWRRADKQLCEAEAIASQHATGRFGARVDGQAEPLIQKANDQYAAKVYNPLQERRAFPRALSFNTLAKVLEIHGTQATESQLAAPSTPPELTRPADVTVRVHESTINNTAETVLTGMRLSDDMVQRASLELLGKLPDQLKPEQNQEQMTIVFPPANARVQPVTVSFSDGGFSVTLRGQEYIVNDERRPGMNITANYKFVKTPEGYHAVRQGDLQIYGFGQVPGAKRSLRQQGIYTALQRKFGKVFAQDIKLKGIIFNDGKLAAVGPLVPQEIISQDGWLAVGYSRVKPSGVAMAAKE